jgi:hypothetical protein
VFLFSFPSNCSNPPANRPTADFGQQIEIQKHGSRRLETRHHFWSHQSQQDAIEDFLEEVRVLEELPG